MKKLILAIIFAVAGLLVFVATRPEPPEESIHFHAGFQVYKNDSLENYSRFEYMKIEPCGTDHEEVLDPEHEQLERAHLHDNIGDVVHVHREGATWGDLFTNINVDVTPTTVYINGGLFEGDILSYEIATYDTIVVFEGEVTDIEDKLNGAVTKEHIMETEKKSENCGS